MNKQAIEVAALLIKWRRTHDGKQCPHVFTDVILRGGPRINHKVIRGSERQCEGRLVVDVITRARWVTIERKELVWLHDRGYERFEDAYIRVRCPVCGQEERSERVVSEKPAERQCKDIHYDDIPF